VPYSRLRRVFALPFGFVQVDNEIMAYAEIVGNTLTGLISWPRRIRSHRAQQCGTNERVEHCLFREETPDGPGLRARAVDEHASDS